MSCTRTATGATFTGTPVPVPSSLVSLVSEYQKKITAPSVCGEGETLLARRQRQPGASQRSGDRRVRVQVSASTLPAGAAQLVFLSECPGGEVGCEGRGAAKFSRLGARRSSARPEYHPATEPPATARGRSGMADARVSEWGVPGCNATTLATARALFDAWLKYSDATAPKVRPRASGHSVRGELSLTHLSLHSPCRVAGQRG